MRVVKEREKQGSEKSQIPHGKNALFLGITVFILIGSLYASIYLSKNNADSDSIVGFQTNVPMPPYMPGNPLNKLLKPFYMEKLRWIEQTFHDILNGNSKVPYMPTGKRMACLFLAGYLYKGSPTGGPSGPGFFGGSSTNFKIDPFLVIAIGRSIEELMMKYCSDWGDGGPDMIDPNELWKEYWPASPRLVYPGPLQYITRPPTVPVTPTPPLPYGPGDTTGGPVTGPVHPIGIPWWMGWGLFAGKVCESYGLTFSIPAMTSGASPALALASGGTVGLGAFGAALMLMTMLQSPAQAITAYQNSFSTPSFCQGPFSNKPFALVPTTPPIGPATSYPRTSITTVDPNFVNTLGPFINFFDPKKPGRGRIAWPIPALDQDPTVTGQFGNLVSTTPGLPTPSPVGLPGVYDFDFSSFCQGKTGIQPWSVSLPATASGYFSGSNPSTISGTVDCDTGSYVPGSEKTTSNSPLGPITPPSCGCGVPMVNVASGQWTCDCALYDSNCPLDPQTNTNKPCVKQGNTCGCGVAPPPPPPPKEPPKTTGEKPKRPPTTGRAVSDFNSGNEPPQPSSVTTKVTFKSGSDGTSATVTRQLDIGGPYESTITETVIKLPNGGMAPSVLQYTSKNNPDGNTVETYQYNSQSEISRLSSADGNDYTVTGFDSQGRPSDAVLTIVKQVGAGILPTPITWYFKGFYNPLTNYPGFSLLTVYRAPDQATLAQNIQNGMYDQLLLYPDNYIPVPQVIPNGVVTEAYISQQFSCAKPPLLTTYTLEVTAPSKYKLEKVYTYEQSTCKILTITYNQDSDGDGSYENTYQTLVTRQSNGRITTVKNWDGKIYSYHYDIGVNDPEASFMYMTDENNIVQAFDPLGVL